MLQWNSGSSVVVKYIHGWDRLRTPGLATRWQFGCFQPCQYKWHWVPEVYSEICKWSFTYFLNSMQKAWKLIAFSKKVCPSFKHNGETEPEVEGTTSARALVYLWSVAAYVLNVTLVGGGTGSTGERSCAWFSWGKASLWKLQGQ